MRLLQGILVGAAIVLLWSAAFAGIWAGLDPDAMFLVLALAMTVTIVAWLTRLASRLHDDDRRQLLLTIAGLTTPRVRSTDPLRRVR